MKSASVVVALLASVALAQPRRGHRHHHQKKDVVVEWETVWETVTEIIDENHTETIFPAHPTTAPAAPVVSSTSEPAAKFIETPVVVASLPPPVVPSSSTPAPVVAPSSTYVAPVPEVPSPTYVAPAPVQTTAAPVAQPSTYVAPAPAPASTPASSASSGGSSSGGSQYTGEITYYAMGPTACGDDYTGEDKTANVVALPHEFMGPKSSYGPGQPANEYCGKSIIISANGKTATGVVHDKCMGCVGMDVDVSEKIFLELFGSTDIGRTKVSWSFA